MPAHAYADTHLSIWGIGEGDDYEKWCEDNPSRLPNGTDIKQPVNLSYDNFLIEMSSVTYNKVKIEGTLHESEETPASGEIARMFNVPDFAYIRYHDPEDGGRVRYWEISNVGEYYPDGDIFGENDWWECDPLDNDPLDGHFYIENTGPAVPAEYKGVDNTGNRYTLSRIWAIEEPFNLVKDAINYASGLMKYFKDTAQVINPDYFDIQTYLLYPSSQEMVPDLLR